MDSCSNRLSHRRYVGLLALALGGCFASEPTVEDVASAEEPLVGGIDTSLRPEVGTMTWGNLGCTATLVGSRYVLTAGHCVNFSTSLNGAAVKLPKSASSYPVSLIHLFGANKPALFSLPDGVNRVDDVALLQLSSAVPASVASGAIIAPVPPNAYSPPYGTQTIFGYGCKNRSPETGGGNKQYVTFTFGNNTQVLCSGDSGGPVFEGSQTANGKLWAVNSGFDTQSGIDSFGSATYYKEDLLNVIRGWEGQTGSEVGVARTGIDYSTTTVASITVCMQACQDDAKCRGFTFRNSSGRCELKSAVWDWYFDSDAQSMTRDNLAQEILRGRPGNTYKSFNATSPDACLQACAGDATCKAYSLNPSGTLCDLKNAVPAAVVDFVSISGVKRGLENNIDRPGTDFSHAAAANTAACQDTCAKDYRCRTFTYVGGVCYLHSMQTNPVARTGAVSGQKRGLEMNTDRPGSDYKSYDVTFINTPLSCQADCAADTNCKAFTWSPAGWRGRTNPHCWLKNGVPNATTKDELVSGLKGRDFF